MQVLERWAVLTLSSRQMRIAAGDHVDLCVGVTSNPDLHDPIGNRSIR
jgi:hypothetical protein